MDVINLQTQPGVAATPQLGTVLSRNQLEQNASDPKTSDTIVRLEFEPKHIGVKLNGSFQVGDIVEDGIKVELHLRFPERGSSKGDEKPSCSKDSSTLI